ncbi:glioma pathogenesis-related protein 1 isoform X3 [Bubalus kerabau]|uniref:glioma pathogenesis-related protein 1 isoform X3 n=1 Tax=Bubalus carabanensis TaxID=3119969 RepID=UPI00244EEFD3|nr:glioma pathogenesis-related protein 1 isoform X3 [Bubalus carabanensis]
MSDSLSSQVTLAVTAWMLSVVSSSSAPANTLPDIKNEVFIKDCVRMHNKFRSSVTPAASDMLYMPSQPGTMKLNTMISRLGNATKSVAITLRLSGQTVTKLAVQYTFVLEFLALKLFSMEHILYATTDQLNPQRDKVTRMYINLKLFKIYVSCVTALWGTTLTRVFHVCFTGYYSTVFPDWPIFPRDRYTSLFLIILSPILILSVIIIIWAKGKYPHLFTLK